MKRLKPLTRIAILNAIDEEEKNDMRKKQKTQEMLEVKDKEIERLNNIIDKTIKIIVDYICTYDYTSGELKNIADVFVDLLNTLKGDEKE